MQNINSREAETEEQKIAAFLDAQKKNAENKPGHKDYDKRIASELRELASALFDCTVYLNHRVKSITVKLNSKAAYSNAQWSKMEAYKAFEEFLEEHNIVTKSTEAGGIVFHVPITKEKE